jgi:hypothetical protein
MSDEASLKVVPPAVVRLFNRAFGTAAQRGIDMRADAFRRRGELTTGLHDFGHASFHAHLESACRSLHPNSNLSPFGRFAAATFYHFHVENRLRIVDVLNQRSWLRDKQVKAPIFIVGFYRTGTTQMHNLLGADPRHRVAYAWELMSPTRLAQDPKRDGALRRLRSRLIYDLGKLVVPEARVAHHVELEGPEEEFFLMENDFLSTTLINTYQGYDYGWETLDWDMAPIYESLRHQLNILAEGEPERRWILKTPYHLWHLAALHRAFPDARFVFTHRSVPEALASNCSLSAMTTSKFAVRTDLERLGRFWFDFYQEGMRRAFAERPLIPEAQRIDVPLTALAKNPMGTLRAIYEYFDLPFDEIAERPIRRKLDTLATQAKATGKHRYRPSQFGLSDEQVATAFSSYEAFYRDLVERFPVTHSVDVASEHAAE